MSDLSKMTGKEIPSDAPAEETLTPTVASAVPYDAPIDEAIEAANADKEVNSERVVADYRTLPPVDQIKPQIKRVHTPGQIDADLERPAEPDAPQPGETYEQTLNAVEMGMAEEQAKFAKRQAEQKDEMAAMFANSLKEEEERVERLIEKEAQIKESGVQTMPVTAGERKRNARMSDDPQIDPYDLAPGYTDDELESDNDGTVSDKNEASADNTPPDPGSAEFGDYIRGLPVTDVVKTDASPVTLIREPTVTVVPNKKAKNQVLGDTAFMNAITNFKKTTFGKVTVPMVNSGFIADVVGTGVVDLQSLYITVNRDTTAPDYDIEKMKVVIRNVVGTTPKIQSMDLAGLLHYCDYDMLAYGHVCATLKKVETIATCTTCGAGMRLNPNPEDLLLNGKEIRERWDQIEAAPNIEAYSLMTHYHTLKSSVGIDITLGHPSYAEYIRCIAGFNRKLEEMTPTEQDKFRRMRDVLIYIRKAELPSGAVSNNIYQHYLAINMISDSDFDYVTHEIDEMKSKIIVPKYGIKEAVCPVCGAVIKDIPYEDLADLLFTHTLVGSLLNNPKT